MYNVNKNHKKTATAPHNTRRCIWQCMALIVCVVLIIGAVIALADAYYDSTPPPLYEYIYTTGYNYAGEYSESNLPPSYEYSSAYVYGYADEYSSSYYGHSYSYGTVYYDYEQTYANEAPVYSQEYDNQSGGYYHEYIPGHINDAPTYLYDTFINVHAVIGMPGAEFTAIVESLTGTGHGGTTQFLLQYINTVNASIYGVYEITAPRLEGYNLVYWLSADLDSYGTPNFYSPVMISNTYPDSDYDHYHTANVVLSQTGGTRVYAVFMPVEYDMARGGIVPFGSPVPPFWVEFDANLGTLGTGQSPRITIINQPLANPPFGRIGVNFPTPPTMLG
ncbi:MAG: hypothetical protein FWC92_12040, partial [Defluviitaleaceae bacterium]|nr:hypothetical protein [Defluviitaleaceae bacterium]